MEDNDEQFKKLKEQIMRTDGLLFSAKAESIANAAFILENARAQGIIYSYDIESNVFPDSLYCYVIVWFRPNTGIQFGYKLVQMPHSEYCDVLLVD